MALVPDGYKSLDVQYAPRNPQIARTLTADYALDVPKALKHKLKASERPLLLVKEQADGGGLYIKFQTALYEVLKAVLVGQNSDPPFGTHINILWTQLLDRRSKVTQHTG